MTTVQEATDALQAMLLAPNGSSSTQVQVFVSEAVKPVVDADGGVHAHIILHPSAGAADRTDESLQGTPGQRVWRCQATCVGGDTTRALRAVQRVQTAAVGQQLTATSGFLREAGDLGNVQPDRTVSPPRWFLPIDLYVEL